MAVALQEGASFRNQEVEIERPDGSRITALVNIDPIRDANGNITGAINVFHDITALKEAEQKLKDEDRRKDEFLATLAHELRNPLAPIRNGLNILRMTGQHGAAASHVQEIMERQVAHMVRLVDDLLELSRISRGKIELKRETFELATLVRQALEISRPFIESGQHHLEVSLSEESLLVNGDLVRLSQVLANLVNNAAKYTDNGGTISVVANAVDDQVVISVRDTGIGIPRGMLDRIFDMFAQVNNPLLRSQEGLGIGLNLVQSLVQMHGGTVEAHSEGLGMGSEFIVRLPRAVPQSEGVYPPELADSPETHTGSACRILCVDDNRDSANSLAMMLKFLGADVHTAYDGHSALDAIKICRPSIILMDLGMPGMDGCEVARLIRQDPEYKNVLLIAMTGWGQEEDRRRSREAGFDHHLVKPVDLSALQALLATA
jgi:signal transduction histidine kinase/CheY-like chemotaxis protein